MQSPIECLLSASGRRKRTPSAITASSTRTSTNQCDICSRSNRTSVPLMFTLRRDRRSQQEELPEDWAVGSHLNPSRVSLTACPCSLVVAFEERWLGG